MTKPLFIMLLFTCLFMIGCEAEKNNSGQKIKEPKADIISTLPDETSIHVEAIEENNKKNSHPEWIDSLYHDSIKTDYAYNLKRRNVIHFKRLNDSVTVCIYETEDGLCLNKYLASQVDKKEKDVIEITNECDHDQKVIMNFTYDYYIKNDTCVIVLESREFIPDSLLGNDGMMDEDKYFDDYAHNTDEKTIYYSVSATGEIMKK